MIKRACRVLAITTASLTGFSTAYAGGFALIEQGASGMGTAYAGASAVSNDTSTVWFNPAGMLELEQAEFASAFHIIAVDSEFSDRGTTLSPAFAEDITMGLDPVPGERDDGIGDETLVPNIYYVRPLRDNMTFGFGISVPFGNSTEYDEDWVGRYQAVESSVSVIDINPSFAYRVNEKLGIGGGISVQFMSATLGNEIDSAASCQGFALLGLIDIAQCLTGGLTDEGNRLLDGSAKIEGDSTEITFNLGLLYKPQPRTKIGVAYRHGVDHKLDGDADFSFRPDNSLMSIIEANDHNLFQDGGATALARLPASLMFSVAHLLNDKVQLLADATWTQWSVFEELRIVFDNPSQPDTFNTQDWDDVWRLSAGVNYFHSDKLTLKTGWAFDQDPVPSPTRRTARIPGNDRTWLSLGLSYALNNSISFDLGYAHLLVDETSIANPSDSPIGTTIRGVYDQNINLFSAQLNWQMN